MKKEWRPTDNPEELKNTALADLLREKGFAPSPQEPAPPPAPPPKKTAGVNFTKVGKIVVRSERKGRGGKTVTIIRGIGQAPPQLEEIARQLRKALGCGSTVEYGDIILQGDIVPRAVGWLQEHGAVKVVIG